MTTPRPSPHSVGRSERLYRMFLVAYPRDFRREYGEDLVQGFRDLLILSSDSGNVWWRTTRDLISSAAKERGASLSGGRRPSPGVLLATAAAVLMVVVAGPGVFLPLILLPALVLIGLPVYGITRFHRAWVIRRTTGGAIARQLLLGVLAFVLSGAALVYLGEDAGYLVFIAIGSTLIVGSALGILWAIVKLFTSSRSNAGKWRWVRPLVVLVPSLAILGFIIGASYNSYRNSLGPPGDHSVENASADTRALWEAANAGDVDAVVELTAATCADPWVKFPVGNGRHNAKGQAETNGMVGPGHLDPQFDEIADILGDYMDDWYDRCGQQSD